MMEMVKQGRELAVKHPKIAIKIPRIPIEINPSKYFSYKGIKSNITLDFSVGQVLSVAKAGTTYVSSFLGRLDDICVDGMVWN
jgi:transaldolase